jgi:hypothetical protein
MQQYVIFNVLKEYCISKEEEDTEHKTTTKAQHRTMNKVFPKDM